MTRSNILPTSSSVKGRETAMTMSSSSSYEAKDLDGVRAKMYCVWRPKGAEEEEEGGCKKSGSAGCYSKRWKLKDLLSRSNSDGSRDRFVFLPNSNNGKKNENNEKQVKETPAGDRKVKPAATAPPSPPCNRDGSEKQRPYRQDLVGFIGNVNGLSAKLQPI